MTNLPSWAADTLTAIAVIGFTWGWTFLATVDWAHPTNRTHTTPED